MANKKYLCFEATTNYNSVALVKTGSPDPINISYSTDNCATWNAYTLGEYVNIPVGEKVYWKSSTTTFSKDTSNFYRFNIMNYTDPLSVSGEVNSLIKWAPLTPYCFYHLFQGAYITTPPELPSTTLAEGCYFGMFENSGLVTAPALPATKLEKFCYRGMFESCRALTEAPELPSTELAQSCYLRMFYGCISLTKASALPASKVEIECYREMYCNCTNLIEAPVLGAQKLEQYSYFYMFYNCSNLAEITMLASDIPYTNSLTSFAMNTAANGVVHKSPLVNDSVLIGAFPTTWTKENYKIISLNLATTLSSGTHKIQFILSDDNVTKLDSELSNSIEYIK